MRASYLLGILCTALPAFTQPALVSSASHLDFQWSLPATQSDPQTFTVTSAGGGEVDFTFTLGSGQDWVVVGQSGNRTPATFAIAVRQSLVGRAKGTTLVLLPSRGDSLIIPITQELTLAHASPKETATFPMSISFTTTQGLEPPAQQLFVTGNSALFGQGANVVSDKNWLRVNGDYGSDGFSPFNISCVCSQLPAGTYSGVVNVETGFDEQYSAVPVTLTITSTSGGLSAATSTLAFDYQVGGSVPTAQTVAISSTTSAVTTFRTAATTQSGNWLSVSPSSATTPSNISVSANPADLTPATYSGTITLTPNSGTAITIPVTLTVRAAAPISASAASLAFSYRQGDPPPASQTVQIAGGGASPSFTVQVPGNASWLTASPASGTAPASITVSVDPSKLVAGSYSANLTINGTGSAAGAITIPVSLQITAPLPTISKIVNAASYAEGSIAPGEILTIFGSAIGPDALVGLALDASGKVTSTLGAAQVLFDGIAAPLIYVSKSQIAVVAPYELAGRQDTTVLVSWNGQRSNGVTLPVTTTAPGIFTANSSGSGLGAIAHADGSINSAANPAAAGDTVIVYVTGEGQTSPNGVTGAVTTVSQTGPLTPGPVLPVAVLIGGQAAQFVFAGEAPGFVAGVMQLNVQIPAGLAAGTQPISVAVGGNRSQGGVTVSVK